MPDKNIFSIKDEFSVQTQNGNISNYIGFGHKYSSKKGTCESIIAFKATETTVGGFAEIKYNTPKLFNTSLENRTRIQIDQNEKVITDRIAGKFNYKFNDKCSIYEILGVNAKISLDGDGLKSLTPLSLTGFGYNVTTKINLYMESELSKGYNVKTSNWNKMSHAFYVGAKYTF